ncbi:MAG TPA: hypothetical protein VEJ36_02655 [Nitrososphaerales archaeon]|nr:hypothetical protein [Nitrososphaerales archaeon]
MQSLSIDKASKYFLYFAVANLIGAVLITIPVIVPEFTFPLVLTVWPGTWIFIAYFIFLIVAVMGNIAWAALLDMTKRHFGRSYVNRYMAEAQFSLTTLGVYGQTSLMFTVGYLGGYAALLGFGKATITQGIIGWMVVPIGVFILLYLIGTIIGIANLLFTISGRNDSP